VLADETTLLAVQSDRSKASYPGDPVAISGWEVRMK
jgi:hypothetical protein